MSVENIRDSDEIDLTKLFNSLWEGKWIIITWTIVAVLLALAYALLRTPIYKVEAIISQSQSSSLTPIQPSILNVANVEPLPRLNEKVIYNSTLLQLNSTNVIRDFWSAYSKTKVEKNDEKFLSFVKSLSINSVNPKAEEPQSRKVAVNFKDPGEGSNVLDAYLDFINKRIQKQYAEDVNRSLRASLAAIDNSIALLEANGQENLSYDLLKLKENYEIAKSLKITSTPYKDLENIGLSLLDGRDYLLGTDALGLQIAMLSAREGKSLRAYDRKIDDLFLARTIVQSDLTKIAQFKDVLPMFKVENRAESSVDPVGIRKIVLLIFGMVGGLFIGCLHVLFSNLLKSTGD